MLYNTRPAGGEAIASLSVSVIRGGKNPFVVEVISTTALELAAPPLPIEISLVSIRLVRTFAHAPSPLQNVAEEAELPEFKLVTGRLPVTPLLRLTCAHAGLLEVPVLDRYWVAVADLASLDRVLLAEA